ncbi:lysoplasmalogenase [Thalassotalea euphylliae]|uniref:lysoplasmalogenase n=1 Tax=Thalassotalea euphylliae TaxID=1655234 RepID=UPI0036314A61
MNKNYPTMFVVTALFYLAILGFAPFMGQFLPKTLPIALLFLWAFNALEGKVRSLMLAAIGFSAIGDISLTFAGDTAFVIGLSAFLLAHVFYTVLYSGYRSKKLNPLAGGAAIVLIGYAGLMANFLLPHTDNLALPVALYLSVITLMGIFVLISRLPTWVVFGALSFVLSDSLLAYSLFVSRFSLDGHAVMVTYYIAQFAMLKGMIEHQLNEPLSEETAINSHSKS